MLIAVAELPRKRRPLEQRDAQPLVRSWIKAGRTEERELAAQDVDRPKTAPDEIVLNLGVGIASCQLHAPGGLAVLGQAHQERAKRQAGFLGGKRGAQLGDIPRNG